LEGSFATYPNGASPFEKGSYKVKPQQVLFWGVEHYVPKTRGER
jgi:hypothetical protein